ncbi:MAG: hypothetical protein WB809_07630 [Thermoplasmata archaeon]
MVAKALWTSIMVVGILAVGGLGFAAFTASYQVNIQGTAGNLSVSFDGGNVMTSQSYVGCWVSGEGANWLNVSAGPFAPGDWCEVFGNVTNTGNVPAAVTTSATLTDPAGCFEWALLLPSVGTVTVAPGGTIAFQGALELNPADGNSCQNTVGTLSVTFSASAGNANLNGPFGP